MILTCKSSFFIYRCFQMPSKQLLMMAFNLRKSLKSRQSVKNLTNSLVLNHCYLKFTNYIIFNNPVTTSTAERSFSALKRIKTYLRSSMTQQRLNHCMLLHVLRHKTDSLSLEDIAKEFMERNERRSSFFGRFS